MEDIKTATEALRALEELGYPLGLSSINDYLAKIPKKVMQFHDEESLSCFLRKFPSMFWIEGGKVYPTQMKPKGGLRATNKTQLQQSSPKVQSVLVSKYGVRQEDQELGRVEELKNKNRKLKEDTKMSLDGKEKEVIKDSSGGTFNGEENGDEDRNKREEDRKDGQVQDDQGKIDKGQKDDTQEKFDKETLQKQAVSHFIKVLKTKGSLPLRRIHGYIGTCPVQVRQAVDGGPVGMKDLFLKYPHTFTVDANDVVHLKPSTAEVNAEDETDKTSSTSQPPPSSAGNKGTADVSNEDVAVPSSSPDSSSSDKDSDIVECKVPGGTADMEALLEEGAAHIVEALQKKGSMPLNRIHGHINQCREEVRQAVGGGPEKARALFLKFPGYFYIDAADNVHLISALVEEAVKSATETSQPTEPGVATTDQDAVEFFRNKVSEKGPVSLQVLSTCFASCPMAIRHHVGSSVKGLTKFFKDHSDTFNLGEGDRVVSLVDSSGTATQEAEPDKTDKKTIAYFEAILSSKGPTTIHVLSTRFGECGEDIRWHVESSKEGLTKFFIKHPDVFKVDSNQTVDLKNKTTFNSQCTDDNLKSKEMSISRPEGASERSTEKGKDNSSLPCQTGSAMSHKQKTAGKKQKRQKKKYVRALKEILSMKECIPLSQLVKELTALLPSEKIDLSGVRLFLKKHPDIFHLSNKDEVMELPPVNALAIVTVVESTFCFGELEDGSSIVVYIALYRERMGVDCTSLKDHLSSGDVLLLDTEHSTPGSTTVKWAAKNIKGVFKASLAPAASQEANLLVQMPMPFLPATTVTRSPTELDEVIANLVTAFLQSTSPLHIDVLRFRMRYLNHDAVLHLRGKGGLLAFLEAQPQRFQIKDGSHVALVNVDTAQQLTTPKAKCTIGEVGAISNSTAQLLLPTGQEAILNLSDVQDSISTSWLSVGDSMVLYIVPSPDQTKMPCVVTKVKRVMGRAIPTQIHAKTATATHSSHLLLEVLQQCVSEEEVDTVLAWHGLLCKKTKISCEDLEECLKGLPKKVQKYTSENGGPRKTLEKYPALFYVDEVMGEVCLVECNPKKSVVFLGGGKPTTSHPAKMEESTDSVQEKPCKGIDNSLPSVENTDQDAVEFFRDKVSAKGQVSLQDLSTYFGSCSTAIRQHVGSSQKGLAKFLQDHPDTFRLDETNMVCIVQDTLKTVKPKKKVDHIAQKTVAHFQMMLSRKGPSTIHVLSSNFGECDKDVRMHVGSSEVGLAKFLMDHPETFTVDANQVVHLNNKMSHQDKDEDVTKAISNSLSIGAPKHHQHSASVQVVEEDDLGRQGKTLDVIERGNDQSSLDSHNGSASLQEENELPTNVQEDAPSSNVSPVSQDTQVRHMKCQLDQVESQQEPEEEMDPVDVEKETIEYIVDLVQTRGQISLSTLHQYVKLLGEDKQQCIEERGGLVSFLEHHLDEQVFKIDHASERISLKEVQDMPKTEEPEPDFLTENSDNVDTNKVVTPELVGSKKDIDLSNVSPVQRPPHGHEQDQEEVNSDSTVIPTATVHPMAVTNESSNVPSTSHSHDVVSTEGGSAVDHDSIVISMDSAQDSPMTEAVRTVTQVSHTGTAVETNALPLGSTDNSSCSSQGSRGTQETPQAGSMSGPLQGQLLNLLVGQDGTRVWLHYGEQDMQPFAAVKDALSGAPSHGQPDHDDFTCLLPMFKDNLSPILDNLVEVEMDIGRIPIARYYNPESPCLLAASKLSEQTLSRETMGTILSTLPLELSAVGQGRVLLKGSLHWVSTLKNTTGEVVGLTLRRGQAVYGCLDLLWDVVTSGRSTLVLGRPCSGKTTLLREWARVLSDVCYKRVIVVDTLNEIAGGDDIPHTGVGGARRIQVHNRCDQVFQLQTAARNHSPDCIIVDEVVQTQEEVAALQAISLTGIQVVAGVCASSLADLLHHRVMGGLLGVPDPTTTVPTSQQTSPHTVPPVFQVAVQVHNRDSVSVHSDVAAFVRASLEGRISLAIAQHRRRVVTKDRETAL